MTTSETQIPAEPVLGRTCGTCSLCCKVIEVPAFAKPTGVWCPHVVQGKGCGIHETRPDECRNFYCDWLLNDRLTDEWKPERCHFMVFMVATGNVSVVVDPDHPDHWRKPQFYPVLKRYATKLLLEDGKLMTVANGRRMIVVLPDGDHNLGIIPNDHQILVGMKRVNNLPVYEVVTRPRPSS